MDNSWALLLGGILTVAGSVFGSWLMFKQKSREAESRYDLDSVDVLLPPLKERVLELEKTVKEQGKEIQKLKKQIQEYRIKEAEWDIERGKLIKDNAELGQLFEASVIFDKYLKKQGDQD